MTCARHASESKYIVPQAQALVSKKLSFFQINRGIITTEFYQKRLDAQLFYREIGGNRCGWNVKYILFTTCILITALVLLFLKSHACPYRYPNLQLVLRATSDTRKMCCHFCKTRQSFLFSPSGRAKGTTTKLC